MDLRIRFSFLPDTSGIKTSFVSFFLLLAVIAFGFGQDVEHNPIYPQPGECITVKEDLFSGGYDPMPAGSTWELSDYGDDGLITIVYSKEEARRRSLKADKFKEFILPPLKNPNAAPTQIDNQVTVEDLYALIGTPSFWTSRPRLPGTWEALPKIGDIEKFVSHDSGNFLRTASARIELRVRDGVPHSITFVYPAGDMQGLLAAIQPLFPDGESIRITPRHRAWLNNKRPNEFANRQLKAIGVLTEVTEDRPDQEYRFTLCPAPNSISEVAKPVMEESALSSAVGIGEVTAKLTPFPVNPEQSPDHPALIGPGEPASFPVDIGALINTDSFWETVVSDLPGSWENSPQKRIGRDVGQIFGAIPNNFNILIKDGRPHAVMIFYPSDAMDKVLQNIKEATPNILSDGKGAQTHQFSGPIVWGSGQLNAANREFAVILEPKPKTVHLPGISGDQPEPEPLVAPTLTGPLSDVLINPALWQTLNVVLPEEWVKVSSTKNMQTLENKFPSELFGAKPQRIQAFYEAGKLVRFEVIYLESGWFLNDINKKLMDADGALKRAENANDRVKIERDIRDHQKELKNIAKRWAPVAAKLEATVLADLERRFGQGKSKPMRLGNISTPVLNFTSGNLTLRYFHQPEQLVLLSILPIDQSEDFALISGSKRAVKDNVVEQPNGDVVIENIPMVNQESRGYCGFGTLAMVLQYYSLDMTMDQLRAVVADDLDKNLHGGKIIVSYQAGAKVIKRRVEIHDRYNFQNIKREIDDGRPVIVWRNFNSDRQAIHEKWRAEVERNPKFEIADPNSRREQDLWPQRKEGSHSSVITGYHKDRKELLFTESWGETARNARMSAKELEATGLLYFIFK